MRVWRLVSEVKKATVLQEYTTEEQRSVVLFVGTEGLNTKDIHKKIIPFYGRKWREVFRN
jgi:hypothetical protein